MYCLRNETSSRYFDSLEEARYVSLKELNKTKVAHWPYLTIEMHKIFNRQNTEKYILRCGNTTHVWSITKLDLDSEMHFSKPKSRPAVASC